MVGVGHMEQLGRLPGDGVTDFRMTMTDGAAGKAGGKIQVAIAVDIFDRRPLGPLGDQRIRAVRQGIFRVRLLGKDIPRLGPWRRNLNPRRRPQPVGFLFVMIVITLKRQHHVPLVDTNTIIVIL